MNHVNVSPTDGNGPTQGQRKTLTRVGIEPTTVGLDLTELQGKSFSLSLCGAISISRANAHMVHMGRKLHFTLPSHS